MVSNVGQLDNGQTTPTARGGSALPKLHWRQWDMLAWCEDSDGDGIIAVTPGRPPRAVWKQHEYFKKPYQVKPLLDLGLLEYVRTEVYANGASCEIYSASKAGRAAVAAFYAHVHERNRARDEAYKMKVEAEQKERNRIALTAALEEQFKGNYYIPALENAISKSETPFLDVPMPTIAPIGKDGLPVTIREYLLCLWFRLLPDDLYKTLRDFLVWGETIGYDDALAMLTDQDDDQDDETDGDLHSPIGRLS